MNVQAIGKDLLRYIGVTSLDRTAGAQNQNRRTVVQHDFERVAVCINQALQKLYSLGPARITERPHSEVLLPPEPVTLTCTQYSKTITVATWAAWMVGCTIRITGDMSDNEILSATTLLRPFMGSTGTVSATVYADCLALEQNVASVLTPIGIPRVPELKVAYNKEEFLFWNQPHRYGNKPHNAHGAHYTTAEKSIGEPAVTFTESYYDGSAEYMQLRLRVNPMPGEAYPLTFRTKRKPPVITWEDVGNEENDPDVGIPLDMVESILLPFCRKLWMADPHWAGKPEQVREINDQYKDAVAILESQRPQVAQIGARYAA